MHLKQLKLAGFKSFCDPVVIPFPHQLVAVVGPNGCGKSNIIDAVRWVMGESSAKNLRGDSMADVIFNGSTNRKPVGQASVELLFDNSLGRLGGAYASYQEIAVKRVVTRDGESRYYLNGSRCRRRDVTDIFLGTGAGARSYSIIGQDTISRLIEAKPEELRAYLEEAAGISRYKERRRETLLRIEHTYENLTRLMDIREELDRQLLRLEEEAKAATFYKTLKEKERQAKSQLLHLKWSAVESQLQKANQDVDEFIQQATHQTTLQNQLLADRLVAEEQLAQMEAQLQVSTLEFYQLNTDIARLEELMRQREQETLRLQHDKEQLSQELHLLINERQMNEDACKEKTALCKELQLLKSQSELAFSTVLEIFQANEQQISSLEEQWQPLQQMVYQSEKALDLFQHQREENVRQQQQVYQRLEKIEHQKGDLDIAFLQKTLSDLQRQEASLSHDYQHNEQSLKAFLDKGLHLREQLLLSEAALHKAQDHLHRLTSEFVKMESLQKIALQKQTENDKNDLRFEMNGPRIAEMMQVDDVWINAVEWVIGSSLQALLVDRTEHIFSELPKFNNDTFHFVEKAAFDICSDNNYPRLIDKVVGILPKCVFPIDQIFAAGDLNEALTWLPQLNDGQSVITPDGFWLGQGWIQINTVKELEGEGLLQRQQKLDQLKLALSAAEDHLIQLQQTRDQWHNQQIENNTQRLAQEALVELALKDLRQAQENVAKAQLTYEAALKASSQITDEQNLLFAHLEGYVSNILRLDDEIKQAVEQVRLAKQAFEILNKKKQVLASDIQVLKPELEHLRSNRHACELQANRESLLLERLQTEMERGTAAVEKHRMRLMLLEEHLVTMVVSPESDNPTLAQKILARNQLQLQMNGQHDSLKIAQEKQLIIKHDLLQIEEQQRALSSKIQQLEVQKEGLSVRSATLLEAMAELGAEYTPEIKIASKETIKNCELTLASLANEIEQLGAINLVAIEAYQSELTRKQTLDYQHQDLEQALSTLKEAITQMDGETELRLRQTFDQVNDLFQNLFPRLFGGGRAFLALTCDNLLEAGITVMAQPPGKRNNSIHLLSGGEKAMTAVALVFAIFQLNPSPFCMLDEVDAPLDDLNVRRFCDLVRDMSKIVQFLFITHNKVTMELADQLVGVTMREPGVSRVVAVDVEEALAIAE